MADQDRGYLDPGQKKAAEHATAQAVNNLTGVPLTQWQARLSTFGRGIQAAQLARPPLPDPIPAATFDVTESSFSPQPLTLGQSATDAGGGGLPSSGSVILPTQFSIVKSLDSNGDLLLGVFFHSPIQNTGAPGDYLVVAKVLTTITPTPTDTGFFKFTSFPGCLYLKCTCGPSSGWATNDFFTAQTIAANTSAGDLPDGGMFEITYSAGPPVVATPKFTRLLLCTVYAADDIVQESLPQLLVKFATVTGLDSSAANGTPTTFAYPGAP